MGLSMLLGPLVGKLLAGLAVVVGLIAAYLGIRASGARAERVKTELATAKARQEAQDRLDVAQSNDVKIDAQAQQDIAAVTPSKPASPASPPIPGDKFKFLIPLFLAFTLMGCVRVTAGIAPAVAMPSVPTLAACPAPPHPESTVVSQPDGSLGVVLSLSDAQAIQKYLAEAEPCWQAREILLQAYIEKLKNRLQAVGGKMP